MQPNTLNPSTAALAFLDTRRALFSLSLYRAFRRFAGPAVAFRLAFFGGAA